MKWLIMVAVVALLCALVLSAPASAAPLQWEVSAVASQEGATFGGAVSLLVHEGELGKWFADVGVKRGAEEVPLTDWFAGGSTDTLPMTKTVLPGNTRIGAGYLLRSGEVFVYIRRPLW